MNLAVLSLLCLIQVWPSSSRFMFESQVIFVKTIDNQICDHNLQPTEVDILGPCEPLLQVFCLRSIQSNLDIMDCPLGRNDTELIAYAPPDHIRDRETRPGLPNGPVIRIVTAQTPWPGAFQLYIKAGEVDPCRNCPKKRIIAPLDDIFINRVLEMNADFTPIERYNGTSTRNRVILDMRFRVMCQQDYYGANCTRFCVPQNDSVNGYYTCNSDGSFRCRRGFRNPDDNCREAIMACDSSPCANNGSCTSMGAFDFTCQCTVGYTGPTCGTNIDDCASAICPRNSKCVDGVNTFECICLLGTERANTGTPIAAIGAGVAVPLVVIILIIIVTVVLVLVVSKRRAEKHYQMHQGANSAHQMKEKVTSTTAIYATPPSSEATVRKLENSIYGDISDNEDNVNAHDFQNPIYGEAEDNGAQQDEFYTTPQAPQPMSLGMEGGGPEYDYATNPGKGVVTVNIKTSGSTPASCKYTATDESNRKMVELDLMETYEKLQHGNKPPDFKWLSNIEGAEYGSLQ